MADSDDGYQSQRESHFNQQRSSLRSDKSIRTRPSREQSRPHSRRPSSPLIQAYTLPENYGNLNEVAGPPPVENPGEAAIYQHRSLEDGERSGGKSDASRKSRRNTAAREGRSGSRGVLGVDEYSIPDDYDKLNEAASPSPIENPREQRFYLHNTVEEDRTRSRESRRAGSRGFWYQHSPLSGRNTPATELDITALPSIPDTAQSQPRAQKDTTSSDEYLASKLSPGRRRASRFATELYTVSYLILFSILGTLARLGLQWLTFYPGAPLTFSELWANFAGTLFVGFLAEDRRLFRDEWGKGVSNSNRPPTNDEEKAVDPLAIRVSHAKAKKTIPLYIGLATGFCGSFTSFSSFMRDVFFALSNGLPSPINHPYPPSNPVSTSSAVPRNGGYSFMAVCAVIIITVALCYSALKVGAHIAILLEPLTPTFPFYLLRKIIDRLVVIVAWGAWVGAVIMAIWPPDRPGGPDSKGSWANETWRGQVVFACAFAPVGCLLRFYVSLRLNGIIPSFPLGTFCVNIFGTAVLGMAFDLQHLKLGNTGLAGGGRVTCQALQGIMDGFCGALTTVSTWIVELNGLRRGHSYVYGGTSVLCGLGILVCIMGSVKWTVGWTQVACVT
ncbi:hypothetical protein K469DRAFT_624818 [Zopfia rhizophila CBS 207.26]|uniref:Chromosome condensation protein-like protein n=1 Tax=Zopfia rhizophila CBS 207.26 TaxID=1314779 RepID=A0A6A6EHZ1_9PEZI|nr:hypothetical protein K469DRAFT_624818 [Zopfia rhizophila CBS 207.26]